MSDKEVKDLTFEDLNRNVGEVERLHIRDLIDKSVVIKEYELKPSVYKEGDYATIQIMLEGKEYVVNTGSESLIRDLEMTSNKMPYRCKIVRRMSKMGRFYYCLAPVLDFDDVSNEVFDDEDIEG